MVVTGDRVFNAIYGFGKVLDVTKNGICRVKLEKRYSIKGEIVELKVLQCVKVPFKTAN